MIYVRGHKKETINVKVPMVKTPIIREPFSKIAIDIVGPLSRTKKGNKYILTVMMKVHGPRGFPTSKYRSGAHSSIFSSII